MPRVPFRPLTQRLPEEEVITLVGRAKQGDTEAINRLYFSYLKLFQNMYRKRGRIYGMEGLKEPEDLGDFYDEFPLDDCMHECYFRMIYALGPYKPNTVTFATYLYPAIWHWIPRVYARYRIHDFKYQGRGLRAVVEYMHGNDARHQRDLVTHKHPAHSAIQQEVLQDLYEILTGLGRNGEIFIKYYRDDRTLRDIGDEYGLTHERIRQLVAKVAVHPALTSFVSSVKGMKGILGEA
jgi:RNA polymerase sigma factor (sigma-70 family)